MALVVDGGIVLLHCTNANTETGPFTNRIKVFQGCCEFITGLNSNFCLIHIHTVAERLQRQPELIDYFKFSIFRLTGGYF